MCYIPTPIEQYFDQGKSNSHILAQNQGKLTAGAAAKILTKKFGIKISAKDLKPLSTEWHHAGHFKGFNGGQAGKTYFFTQDQVNQITPETIENSRKLLADKLVMESQDVKGWFVKFDRVRINSYGKLGYKPFLGIYEGPKGKAPKSFIALSEEQFIIAKSQEGRAMEAYETPTF